MTALRSTFGKKKKINFDVAYCWESYRFELPHNQVSDFERDMVPWLDKCVTGSLVVVRANNIDHWVYTLFAENPSDIGMFVCRFM